MATLFNCLYENKASDREVQKKLAKIGCNALNFRESNLSPLDCLALVHALKSVEGILNFDLSYNELQSLGDALEGSLGTDVPPSPSNPEHV